MDLDKLRQEIDEIDTQMCDLFARRMQVVSGIGKYKKEKNRGSICCRGDGLLHAEGLAVGALILGGIDLVGAHQDPVQRTVVLAGAVMCALLNGAFNALVCVTVHIVFLLCLVSQIVWPRETKSCRN